MAYPSGLAWGAVFITVGPPSDPPRPRQDLSAYNILSLELRGAAGGECVEVGIKDNTDPDDGSETKIRSCVDTGWQTFSFPLAEFTTADTSQLYVVAEFVFTGPNSQTVDFQNIRYEK